MASIHKDPRGKSPYFYAAFTAADGRRIHRSTKHRDRRAAMTLALEWEKAARQAREKTLTTAQVRRVFNEIIAAAGDEPLEQFTTEGWLREWLAGKENSRGSKTAARYQKPIDDFIAALGTRAKLPLRTVTPKDVRSFRDAETKAGKASLTVNIGHKVLSGAFEAARKLGYLDANPAAAVDYLPTHEDRGERLPFEPEEVARLTAKATEDWKGVILLAYFAGLRLADAARLTWAAVDLEARTINFTPSKTARLGKRLSVPMHPEIAEFLLAHPTPSKDANAPLFPSLAPLAVGGRSGLSRQFSEIMKAAKVAAGVARHAKGEAGRTTAARSFHSLRHSYVTSLAATGAAVELRQKLAGHASEGQSLAYTHPDFARLRAAVDKLPSLPRLK